MVYAASDIAECYGKTLVRFSISIQQRQSVIECHQVLVFSITNDWQGQTPEFQLEGKIRGFGTSTFCLGRFSTVTKFPFTSPSLSLLHLARDHRYTVNNQSSLSLSMRATALILGVLAAGVLLITNQGASALPVFETGT